uniref:Retrovirus-related Pol polyprotein from transposon TNT 1-94 n=1 Tax=Tanacetum cinerariifolium TaxID=118510 RepID=A0A6L2J8I6_TANCI|nr:retrovirus-related Pol polyprotein from transposon TNT 1-94 [Tanacetum cinerariifolium]
MGMVDNTLFTKKKSSNLIIVQIYVDDIIFGLTCQDMCDEFAKIMHDEFEMSMMGELNFFLGLQIKQMDDGIFFNQSKYIKEMLKKFGLEDYKPMKTLTSSDTKLTKDEGQVRRIRHEEEIDVQEYQILTHEILSTMKPLEEIIRKNVFCLGVIGTMFSRVFVTCFIVSYGSKSSTLLITWQNEWSGSLNKIESYVLYDRVMNPLAAQLERKPRKDRGTRRGRHSTSSSTFNQPSSSHLNDDDDDGNNEGTSPANVPPGPLNPQPLQSHPSLNITLSLSPITPLDHIHDTSSPPSPPKPQPPIMGHPLYYNYHDYHRSNCICCFHNQTLFLTLRDEMNIMFAHLEYLLTTAITSHFPPPP